MLLARSRDILAGGMLQPTLWAVSGDEGITVVDERKALFAGS